MARTQWQVSEIANRIIDPVLARRAGISTALIGSWDEIAGADFADCSRPEKITWSRKASFESDGRVEPATLIVACEGARALFLNHARGELIARINGFFGYPAIGQIKIVQKPVRPNRPPRRFIRPLQPQEKAALSAATEGIDNPRLRQALERLGRGVYGARGKR